MGRSSYFYSMIPEKVLLALEAELSTLKSRAVTVSETFKVYGGSINETFGIRSDGGLFFVKINRAAAFPEMFELEMKGLQLLAARSSIKVPQPIKCSSAHAYAFLLMEYLSPGPKESTDWESFGRGMAELHLHSSGEGYGLEEDNYIGTIIQKNSWKESWEEFFILNRLDDLGKLAFDRGLLDANTMKLLEALYLKIGQLFPKEKSSLLHGDLWSGNFLTQEGGQVAIMDPAVYFGHREMDIAMSHLFGGFSPSFYKAYEESFPLEAGWEDRIEICNLYPLLVHVHLFGSSYVSRLQSILKRFV